MNCNTCNQELVPHANFCHNCGDIAPARGGTNQGANAGNNGDRIKHAVLLEILKGTEKWEYVRYRETHAGAGLYLPNDHICEMQQSIGKLVTPPAEDTVGGAYYRSLKSWWDAHAPGYPGGIIHAARWLKQHRTAHTFDIRATENKPQPFSLLSRISEFYGIEVRHDSFLNRQAWLLDGENLVLLVDPYRYVRKLASDDPAVAKGFLNHATLKCILDACASMKQAVVLIWASKGHKNFTKSLKELREDLKGWVSKQGNSSTVQCRCGNYGISVVGINGGQTAVNLPGKNVWAQSWLTKSLKIKIGVS